MGGSVGRPKCATEARRSNCIDAETPTGGGGVGAVQDEESQSQTVSETAPELDQSSLDQYGEGGLSGNRDRGGYAEPSTGSTESEERSGGDVEGRLDRIESEVEAGSPSSDIEKGESVVMDEQAYTELAGGDEQLAQQLQARDELLQEKLEGNSSEGLSKTVSRKTVGAAAGMVVGTALGGPAGTLVGAAAGAAAERKSGPAIEKGQTLATQLPSAVRSGFTTVESKASEYRD